MDYIISERARKEINSSYTYYLENSEKAANEFLIELEAFFTKICSNPMIGRNIYKNNFEVKMKRYKRFTIIYKIREDFIVIGSVFHGKRNPKRKYRGL